MNDARHPASRRHFLTGSVALAATALLGGCDRLATKPWFRQVLNKDDDANQFVQRLLLSDQKLAPEYSEADISPWFKPNGTSDPSDKDYRALVKSDFKTFRLEVGGLVERPAKFTLPELRALAARTQITRHDCVEGWSCIGQWTGVPLSAVLQKVGLQPKARFVVFYCADTMDEGGGLDTLDDSSDSDADDQDADADKGGSTAKGGDAVKTTGSTKGGDPAKGGDAKATMKPADKAAAQPDTGTQTKTAGATSLQAPDPGKRYYESIDLVDAYHPQTILAYEMNGKPLPVAHGAPLRLRLERQLGYKNAKYIMRIELVDDLSRLGKGGGGYWEDNGYEWYAGI